ncbi:MAG: ABC transporter permease [Methylomarinum sp.]|nr:ABC transporter permease [Methylomarinum sp.]
MNTNQDTKSTPPPFNEVIELPKQFMRNKEWLKARTLWAVLRTTYPTQAEPWLQGAITEISCDELELAGHLLAHARNQFPNNPYTYLISAELSVKNKQWGEAEHFLQQARDKYPDNLQLWMKSAECAEHQGKQKQASIFNEKARQCDPNAPAAFIQHAELAMHAEQWELALERWEEFRSRFPEIPAGYLRASEAARQLDRPKQARQLVLAQQYGADILNNQASIHDMPKLHGGHTSPGRLLELIWTKAIFNLRSEVHHNYLSYGWWILEPLLHMVVYYLVFDLLLQRGGENYPVFLLTGLIPWMWFLKAVNGSSNSIITGQNLMLQVGIPSVVFPLVSLLQATLKQIPVFILLFGFLWLQDYSPGALWWALVPVIAVQTLLTIAVASMVAAIIPFIRDLIYLVPTGLTLLMFLSGIFYDYRTISPEWQSLFLLNPMAFLLKCYRELFIDGILPDMQTLTWWGVSSAAACTVMILIYKRLRYIYPRIIME